MSPSAAFDKAIEIAGGQRKLAELLGRPHQSYVSEIRRRLKKRGAVVPAHVCPDIERATKGKIKRTILNPKVRW